MSMQVGLI